MSCPHTSQQSRRTERRHHSVTELGLTLLSHASMPTIFLVEAFQTANYLLICLPSSSLHGKTPCELLFKSPLDYIAFRVVGCECYPYFRPYNHKKLDFRSERCTFIGYSPNH